jgi:hypothetical protein
MLKPSPLKPTPHVFDLDRVDGARVGFKCVF